VVVDFKTRFERAKTRYLERVQKSPGKESSSLQVEDGAVVGEAKLEDEEDIASLDLDQEENENHSPTSLKKTSGQTLDEMDPLNEPLPTLSIDLKDY
jgi:hypothetical protein